MEGVLDYHTREVARVLRAMLKEQKLLNQMVASD